MVAAINEALRRLTENTQERAFEALQTIQGLVRAVIRSVFALGIILMISAYLLVTSERIFDFFRSLVRPSRRQNFDLLVRRIDRGLSGVVRGQLVIALVNGLLSGIAFYALDLRYWPVLTLVATALSIIPIFGAILSSVPAVVIALQDDVSKAVAVALAIVVIHQLEANVFNPKIMGDAAKLHPVLVVFALLAGEHAFGIAGALLAVPVLSILQSAFLHFREVALGISTPRTLRESQLPPPP
ncbi:MAG: AI-2E family transporter [Polyangiales bacterium]